MFYRSDFQTYPNRHQFQPRYDFRRNFITPREKHVKVDVEGKKSTKSTEKTKEKKLEVFKRWFLSFCENTSVHGMKYIGMNSLHWLERTIWSVLVILAIFSIVYISLQLSAKFSNSPLSTVVESTIFPVSEIAYPAITICNHNRFSKERCEEAANKFIPNADNETKAIFDSLVLSLNALEFGAYDEFYSDVLNYTSETLNSLNLTELYEFIMLKCDEIYIGRCWWRNKYEDCCDDFFYVTRSEYGLCFTFNSAVTEIGKEKSENETIHYPFRTSNYGDWSGLRIDLSTRNDIALQEGLDGVIIIVQHPDQWPNSGFFVPTGSQTSVVIKSTYSYTTEDVRRLTPEQRQCLNDDESKSSLTLPGLKYLQMNCVSECRQQYMLKYCGCSVEDFFPTGNATGCNFEDIKCLFNYNDVFNYEKPPTGNPYFDDEVDGMECPCLPECKRVEYNIEIAPSAMLSGDNMTLDFHYQTGSIVKYRTDVTFGWLDLMVSFGGIAGLFLGCSILSGVEIIYYLFLILLMVLRKVRSRFDKLLEKYSNRIKVDVEQRKPKKCFRKKGENIKVIKIQSLSDLEEVIKAKNKTRY